MDGRDDCLAIRLDLLIWKKEGKVIVHVLGHKSVSTNSAENVSTHGPRNYAIFLLSFAQFCWFDQREGDD